MNKKLLSLILAAILILLTVAPLTSCGGGSTPEPTAESTAQPTDPMQTAGETEPAAPDVTEADTHTDTPDVTEADTQTPPAPSSLTAADVAAAIAKTMGENVQRLTYTLKLSGTIAYQGYSMTLNDLTNGDYSYDRASDAYAYKKVSSGTLLPPMTTYEYSKGGDRIHVALSDNGTLINADVTASDGKEPIITSTPFTAIVKALDEQNLVDIRKETGEYGWSARMMLASDDKLLQSAFDYVEGLGTLLAFGRVALENPNGGVQLFFNIDGNGYMTGFSMTMHLLVPLGENADGLITMEYAQKSATGTVEIKVPENLLFDQSAIAAELSVISDAFAALKKDHAYSIGIEAENEFDPSWHTNAITDKYTATMYKNGSAFNYSCTYKNHTEEDGKESYKYTIGNIQSGDVILVSRKGSNKYETVTQYSADERFEWLTDAIVPSAAEIKCVVKYVSGGTVSYDVFFTDDAAMKLVDKVTGYVNSNPAPEVVPVNNYINGNAFEITKTSASFELKDGRPVKASCDLQVKYAPVGGEYRGQTITLDEKLELEINDDLKDAQKYEAPKKAESTLGFGGLDFIN